MQALESDGLELKNVGQGVHIWGSMCGEMASEETAIPILLALGLDEYNMHSVLTPPAREIMRTWDTGQAKRLAERALALQHRAS